MRSRIKDMMSYIRGQGVGPMLARATAGSGAVQILGMLVTFLIGIQLARGLGLDGYGQYGIAMAVIAIASIPGEFGIPKLVVRETAAAVGRGNWPLFFGVRQWADSICWKISAGMALTVIGGVFLVLDRPTSGVGAAILLGTPIIPLFALAKIRGATLQGLNHVALGQIPSVLLRPLILSLVLFAAILLGMGLGAPDAMALNSLTAAAALLVVHFLLKRRLPTHKTPHIVMAGRRWLSSAFAMGLSGGVPALQVQLLILLLGLLSTTAEVGLFRIAMSTTVMLAVPMTIIHVVASPTVARLHAQGDWIRLRMLLARSAQAQFAGVLILSLPLLIAGESIMMFVFGAEYGPSAGPLRLLLFGQLVNCAFGLNVLVLNMTHNERRVVRSMLIALILGVATVASLSPLWGRYGAAAAYIVSMTVWNVLTWLDARRQLGIDTSIALRRPRLARSKPSEYADDPASVRERGRPPS